MTVPHTLVLAVATLDLLVYSLLDLLFEDTCALGLVQSHDFEDLCRV